MRSRTVVFLLAVGLLLGRSAFGTTQLISDGLFTNASPASYWSILPESTDFNAISFGAGFLEMGGVPGGTFGQTLYVAQTLTIPANILYAQFSFVLTGTSPDVSGYAEFAPVVENPTGIGVLTNLGIINNNGTFAETVGPFNLSAFIGQTVDITFAMDILSNVVDSSTVFEVSQVSLLGYTSNDIPANDDFSNSAVLNTTTNISVSVTNIVATVEPGEPKIGNSSPSHSVWWNWTPSSDGVVTINTKGSNCKTLLGVYTGSSLSSLTQVAANNSGGTDSQVSFPAAAGTTYQIAVDSANGSVGTVYLNLSFTQTAPTVTIKSPASNAKLTNSTVTVEGTASDKVAVGQVQVQLINANGTNAFQNATGSNSWTATVTGLTPGPNTINAIAYDTSGNASKTASRTVTFIVVSPLTLTITGSGTVSPDVTNKLLDVGANYSITAKPGTGEVFSNWTDVDGAQIATTAALTFTMQSNLVLQANFVPNPFTPLVGDYQGLFFDDTTNGPEQASSGFFNVTLSSSGSYSAKVIVAGVNYSLSGQFSAGGVASNNIVRKGGLPPVSVQMQLGLDGSGISGTLSDGVWVGQLNADKVATSAGAEAGKYTLIIPGQGTEPEPTNPAGGPVGIIDPNQPGVGGDSYGTLTVSSTGIISFSGALADSTKVTQKANLTSNGQWAFYVPLYSGSGSIFGWLTFNDLPDSDITGTVYWFKPAQPAAKFYSGGITNITDAIGSIYLFTNGVPLLNLPGGDGVFSFSYENDSVPPGFGDQISLSTANKITSTNALTATITTSSGLFKVTTTDPNTGKTVTANGVVLQKQNSGLGFFSQTNQTAGLILLTPAD